jgi:hypothetical protein
MGKTRYQFKINFYGPEADAQAIGEAIDALIDAKKEHVTAEELVAAGRPSTSPLHIVFTYDENAAADKWRKHEAKQLIKNLHLASKDDADKPSKTRAFVYVHHPEHEMKKVLLSTRSAMARPEFREQVVQQAVRALQRSLAYWGAAYGGNPQLRALAKDVEKLTRRAERELLDAVDAWMPELTPGRSKKRRAVA